MCNGGVCMMGGSRERMGWDKVGEQGSDYQSTTAIFVCTYQNSSRLHNLRDLLSATFLSALQGKSSLAATRLKPERAKTPCAVYVGTRDVH